MPVKIVARMLYILPLLSLSAAYAAMPEAGTRMSILVLPCEGVSRQAGMTGLVDDLLMKSLLEQHRFRVIEREKLKQVMAEQQLVREKLTAADKSLRLGRLAGADAVLITTVRETGTKLELSSRLVSAESTALLEVTSATADTSLPGIKTLLAELAKRLAETLPLVDGTVLRSEKGKIEADFGTSARVRKGMGVTVYRKGKQIKHPVTGRSLGTDTVKLAEGTIVEVLADTSVIKLDERSKKKAVAAGDRVVTK